MSHRSTASWSITTWLAGSRATPKLNKQNKKKADRLVAWSNWSYHDGSVHARTRNTAKHIETKRQHACIVSGIKYMSSNVIKNVMPEKQKTRTQPIINNKERAAAQQQRTNSMPWYSDEEESRMPHAFLREKNTAGPEESTKSTATSRKKTRCRQTKE